MRRVLPGLVPAIAVLVTVAAASASAQQVQPPSPRPYRGLFGGQRPAPGEASTTLSLTLSAQGGYDDNVLGGGSFGGGGGLNPQDPRFTESGYTGVGSASLTFDHGTPDFGVDATFTSAVTGYSVTGADLSQYYVGDVGMRKKLGRASTVRIGANAAYQNYFSIGSFAGLVPPTESDLVDSNNPDYGIYDRQSVSMGAYLNLDRTWGRTHSSSAGATLRRQEYLGDDQRSEFGTGDSWSANASHTIRLSRRASVRATYSYTEGTIARRDGSDRPLATQRMEGTFVYDRQLSPRRRLSFEAGAGATVMDTPSDLLRQPTQQWGAVGHARVATNIGRSWSTSANYDRGWEIRYGYGAPFFTDTVVASVGGYLNRRLDLSFSGGWSRGSTGVTVEVPYSSRMGSAQVRYALTRTTALMANYFRYFYQFDSPDPLPEGVLQENDRHAFRVGISFWLPLYGTYGRPGTIQ
jgi:hypothetical protein